MIDDLGPVRQINAETIKETHHLFEPKPAYRMAQSRSWGSPNYKLVAENHPNGVLFNFFIKDFNEEKKVTLEIFDGAGNSIQKFSNKAEEKKQKLKVEKEKNRFVWNMRYPGFKEFPGMVLYSSPNNGPKAIPGSYSAILEVDSQIVEQKFEIAKDPRLPNTDEDYRKQLDYLLAVRNKVSNAHQAMIDIKTIRADIEYFKKKLEGNKSYEEILALAAQLNKDMTVIENNIHMTKNQSRQDPLNYGIRINNRLAFLMADQQRGDFPPTDQADEARKNITAELDHELEMLDDLLLEKLTEINEKGKELGVQIISDRLVKKRKP